jgi:hypothetical protein
MTTVLSPDSCSLERRLLFFYYSFHFIQTAENRKHLCGGTAGQGAIPAFPLKTIRKKKKKTWTPEF